MFMQRNITLKNGLHATLLQQPHLHSCAIGAYIRVGSRDESPEQWGLTHLLEHMLYRGSRDYPSTATLAAVFEGSGGALDGATWRDHTSFTVNCHPTRIAPVLSALADMLITPRFVEIDIEKHVLDEELASDIDEDGHDIDITNISRKAVWGEDPMARRVGGSSDVIRKLTVHDLRAHHGRYYVGHNMALCIAGPCDLDSLETLVHHAFHGLPAGCTQPAPTLPVFAPKGPVLTRKHEDTGQLEILLTFDALPDTHPMFPAMRVLTSVLDDGLSTRLQQAVCDRTGLVYDLTSGLDCYPDAGLYDIALRVMPKRAIAAVQATLESLHTLCRDGISQAEFEQARQQCLYELEFRMDSASDLVDTFGAGLLYAAPGSLADRMATLRALTPNDLLTVARSVFQSRNVHATVMGPIRKTQALKIKQLLEPFHAQPELFDRQVA